MDAVRRDEERFSYALVSAAPLQDSDAAGIGIIFKARDRSTIGTICQALENTDLVTATYEAVMKVLEEALNTGVGRPAIYLDNARVVHQLTGQQPAPREVLALSLRVRAMMNQVGRPQIIAATASVWFSARRLAASARPAGPGERSFGARQLPLLPEDAVV